MMRNLFGTCALAMLACVHAAAHEVKPSPPQEAKSSQTAAEAPVTVTIADTAAPQEWEVSVPVAVKLTDGTQIGRLSMKLVYPAKVLRYASVKSTDSLKGAGFEVKADAPVITGTTGTLPLAFEPTPAAAAAKGIPSVRIAIVVFKVVKDAEEKSWPMTTKDVQAWAFGNAATPVSAASGPPAKFVVSPAGLPIFGCFFYMH